MMRNETRNLPGDGDDDADDDDDDDEADDEADDETDDDGGGGDGNDKRSVYSTIGADTHAGPPVHALLHLSTHDQKDGTQVDLPGSIIDARFSGVFQAFFRRYSSIGSGLAREPRQPGKQLDKTRDLWHAG